MSRYRTLDWVLVRAPLLPIEYYRQHAIEPTTEVPTDPRIRRALAVGAGDLVRALDKTPDSRALGKLQRYLIRMSSRPTPFGLFAGVGLVGWGPRTELRIADRPSILRTRPDMGWLLDFVSEMERDRAGLRWYANPAAYVHAGRVFLSERPTLAGEDQPRQAVSLRATAIVLEALAVARSPIDHAELTTRLMTAFEAPRERVERLVDQLAEQAVLLSDLRPPLTAGDPARYVASKRPGLTELLDQLAKWDQTDPESAVCEYPNLVASARRVHSADTPRGIFQTDMALPFDGNVHHAVAEEAARAAELLLRLSPWQDGLPRLRDYRDEFARRYGADREVPLLELIDPDLGLGMPMTRHAESPRADRDQALVELALGAIKDDQLVVELTDSMVAELGAEPPSAPTSLDLSLFVLAGSAEAVDRGDFQVVVGPNLGALAAGRVLGRFADLLGPRADSALLAAAHAEADRRPGRIWAEVSYLPRQGRGANVAVRPFVRDLEVTVNTTPGAAHSIPVSELVVAIRHGRLTAVWPATGQDVVPCAGHMLNSQGAPAAARFLDEISMDQHGFISTFDWGAAAGFPFLPRIQSGRIVLSPARWRLDQQALTDFGAWRVRWHVPRYVYLSISDHRLLLDLDAPAHVDQIRVEARKGHSLTLLEALPAPEHAWLPGPEGRYLSELVVPLVLAGDPEPAAARSTVPVSVPRICPPGGDWLFVKLYHAPTYEEDLLVGPIRDLVAKTAADGLADRWFFVRYADPEPHVRLRWHGDPRTLTDNLAPLVLNWGAGLVEEGRLRRFGLDSYDREVERYGGPQAIEAAEELFAADSVASLDLLGLLDDRHAEVDRTTLGMYTVNDLLAGLGLSSVEREELLRAAVSERGDTAADYRSRQAEYRAMLGNPDWLAGQPGGEEIAEILARRRAVVQRSAGQFDGVGRTRLELARSFVHMHCNRLLGLGHPPEQKTLGLLARTIQSLNRAPFSPDRAGSGSGHSLTSPVGLG